MTSPLESLAQFHQLLDDFEECLGTLSKQPFVSMTDLTGISNEPGVYVFYGHAKEETEKALYTGRTKQLRSRLQQHLSGIPNKAAFAMCRVRKELGLRRDYRRRKDRDSKVREIISCELKRQTEIVRKMKVRCLIEPDPVRQALLEIFVASRLQCPFNDFGTT
jgi:predicted GIY-YIG superfamily endonuclease